MPDGISKRGFAGVDDDRPREIASEGGRAAHAIRKASVSAPSEPTMNTTAPQQACIHPGCHCLVDLAQAYCSEYCRQEVGAPSPSDTAGCRCGHPACESADAESGKPE